MEMSALIFTDMKAKFKIENNNRRAIETERFHVMIFQSVLITKYYDKILTKLKTF